VQIVKEPNFHWFLHFHRRTAKTWWQNHCPTNRPDYQIFCFAVKEKWKPEPRIPGIWRVLFLFNRYFKGSPRNRLPHFADMRRSH